MVRNLGIGVIGCGRISLRHMQSISTISSANLVAVADVIEPRAQKYVAEYHVDAYTDYRRILDRKDVDIVNVCTPSGMHAKMAIEAMKAGKHVIVEKPMALTLEDADAMIASSKSTGKKMCVVLQNRYNPPMQDLKKLVESNSLGRLLLGAATVRWYRPQEYYEDGWHGTWAMDGGALMNQSIHHIDALQWLLGDVESVFSYTSTVAHRMEAEDLGVAVLKFKNGALGTIEGSTVTYPENLEGSVALFGEKGSVKVGGTALNRKVLWKLENELQHESELIMHDQVDPSNVYGQSHKLVFTDMIHAIMEDRDPKTDGVESRKSLALVLALYESSRSGREFIFGKE